MEDGRPRAVAIEVSTEAGSPLHVRGTMLSTVSVPVQPERRPWRHLAGRPWRLVLDESFTRYEGAGRTGFGIAVSGTSVVATGSIAKPRAIRSSGATAVTRLA